MVQTRHEEILFYHNIEHIKKIIPEERIPLFIELFTTLTELDYTNMMILYAQYLPKLKPSNLDIALMARDLKVTVRRFPVNENYGYRLIRENKEKVLSPNLYNESLIETMVSFNKKYLHFTQGHYKYILEVINHGYLNASK
jgi:hypothetical protein